MKYVAILGFMAVVAMIFVSGCCGSTGSQVVPPTSTPAQQNSATVAPTIASTPIPVAQPDPVSLSGNGQQATTKFRLEQGLTIFEMKHTGSSNFIVHLLNSNGETEEYLANEIGTYDGAQAIHVSKAGDYLLDVDADGTWSITVKQPRNLNGDSVPLVLSGTANQVTKPFTLKNGLTTFKLTHTGSSNFIVHLIDANGNTVEYLVNEIGEFNGSKAIGISKKGIYMLNVDADGDWTIDINQ